MNQRYEIEEIGGRAKVDGLFMDGALTSTTVYFRLDPCQ